MGSSLEALHRRQVVGEVNKNNNNSPKDSLRNVKTHIGRFFHRHSSTPNADLLNGHRSAGKEPPITEGSRRVEEAELPELVRDIEPRDVQTMIDQGWFEDSSRLIGLWGDVINKRTVPREWNEETRQRFRDEVLMPFYFPEGPINIEATDEKGNVIREVNSDLEGNPIQRHTKVMEWKGKLVAARSYMTDDPWASDSERRSKIAHAQMLVVAPDEEGRGFGLCVAAEVQKEIFESGFNRIITWVNLEGINYGRQEQLFRSMGYAEDRNRAGGLIKIRLESGEVLTCRRFILTRKKSDENLASELNPFIRWAHHRRINERQDSLDVA